MTEPDSPTDPTDPTVPDEPDEPAGDDVPAPDLARGAQNTS